MGLYQLLELLWPWRGETGETKRPRDEGISLRRCGHAAAAISHISGVDLMSTCP